MRLFWVEDGYIFEIKTFDENFIEKEAANDED